MNLQFNRGVRALFLIAFGSYASIALAQDDVAQTADTPEKEIFVDVEAPVLEPLDVHARTSLTVVEQLRHNHFVKKPLDDGISSQVFDNYLESLDGGRSYFLATDVAEFEAYRYELDDALKRGNLDAAFTMFNRRQERAIASLNFLIHEIEGGIENIDFTVDEDIEIDRENSPWPATQAEQDALWLSLIHI